MLLIVCFAYCFFAIVLGIYLGLELTKVRKAERVARTMLEAAARTARALAQKSAESDTPSSPTTNYFS